MTDDTLLPFGAGGGPQKPILQHAVAHTDASIGRMVALASSGFSPTDRPM